MPHPATKSVLQLRQEHSKVQNVGKICWG